MARELHPKGSFIGVITDHGFNKTQDGKSQFFIGIQNEDNPEHRIVAFLSFSEKAREYSVKKIRACGYKGFDFNELKDGYRLRGNRIRYEVEHDSSGPGGVIRDKVGWINDPEKSGLKRDDEAAASIARLNDLLKEQPPEMLDSDDVPF